MAEYIMSKRVAGCKGPILCHRCNRLILVGDQVHSVGKQRGQLYRVYHKGCWDGMFYDIPD